MPVKKSTVQIGDIVECQFYNSVEKKFYGATWKGSIVDIDLEHIFCANPFICDKGYLISKEIGEDYNNNVWVKAKEIKNQKL